MIEHFVLLLGVGQYSADGRRPRSLSEPRLLRMLWSQLGMGIRVHGVHVGMAELVGGREILQPYIEITNCPGDPPFQ